MLTRGETMGIFQLESTGMTQVLMSMRPKNLEDVIALISLYRPGPMDSIPTYLRNRKDPSKVVYQTPQMAHIVDVTNGVVIYQEQVMQICRELAGFSFGQADNVRRAMSKKKLKVMEAEREHFVHGCTEPGKECAGCVKNGIPEAVANQIYDDMISFASYAFNKSHAACYAYVAFQTAYLKCHYPHEFMAALLTSVLDNTSKVIEYTSECQRLGIKVLPPDVNESDARFTVSGRNIRFGLVAIKNIGEKFIQQLMQERSENGPFTGFEEFCRRMAGKELGRRAVESLIRSGAFDSLGVKRRALMQMVDAVLDCIATDGRRNIDGQLDLFGLDEGESCGAVPVPDVEEYPKNELMQMERETTGLYLSGHPMDDYREAVRRAGAVGIGSVMDDFADGEGPQSYQDGQYVVLAGIVSAYKTRTTKNGKLMCYVQLEDDTGTMELLIFQKVLDQSGSYIAENAAVIVKGRISLRDEKEPQLMVDSLRPLSDLHDLETNAPPKAERKLWLKLPRADKRLLRRIELLCEMFPGRERMIIVLVEENRRLGAECVIRDSLVRELKELLGEDCVVVK